MAHSAKKPLPRIGRSRVPPTATLAILRVRKTWGLLCITGVGMVVAVLLACGVPLYSNVSMTASLRDVLSSTSPSQDSEVVVNGTAELSDPNTIDMATQELNSEFQGKIGPYLARPQFSVQMDELPVVVKAPGPHASSAYNETKNLVRFIGASMDQTPPHLHLIKGRLPLDAITPLPTFRSGLEIALSRESAHRLNVTVGSIINIKATVGFLSANRGIFIIPLHVVGIFNLATSGDPYWHGNNFLSIERRVSPSLVLEIYTGLISNGPFISVMQSLCPACTLGGWVLGNPLALSWYYPFDPSHIAINNLDDIINGINTAQVDISNNQGLEQAPFLESVQAYLPSDILSQYRTRIAIFQLSVTSLLCLALGLMFFFISMMVTLLVDRQSDAVAILRSRGGSRLQIFGSLMTQSLGLGLIALLVGPLLALAAVRLVALNVLSPPDRPALNTIFDNPLQATWGVRWYALLTVLVAIIAMAAAASSTMSQDVLGMRRELARSTRQPLWRRLNLDIVAAIVMIVGYGFTVYVSNEGILDAHLTLLLLSPLTLLGSICLLLASLLLFLRFFPSLLRLGSWLAVRSHRAAPMLALAQMARSPGQSVRMTLLLALATAFAVFTLIFTASQYQRILDIANYQSGADFSGTIAFSSATYLDVLDETDLYRRIPGVVSATMGNISSGTAAGHVSIDVSAVDADTFAQTSSGFGQGSSQSLMQQLASQRTAAISRRDVPAIVDAATWKTLELKPMSNFALSFADGSVNFVAIAEVPYIPAVNTQFVSNLYSSSNATAGILVDYPSFAATYGKDFQAVDARIPLNTVWLRTKDDSASLASVRKALNQGTLQLTQLYDRRAIIDSLSHEPLYLDLLGVLALGAAIVLLLALVGDLIASWLSARGRLANFAVLRALGADPRQIASTLAWEQCIIYSVSIILGLLFGLSISLLVVPVLVFTGASSSGNTSTITSGQFYVAQSVPPIQVIIPPSLAIALVAFVVICVVALGMMVRVVSRPSMSQTLRLNED